MFKLKRKQDYYIVCAIKRDCKMSFKGFVIESDKKLDSEQVLDNIRETIAKECDCDMDNVVVLNWKQLKN